MFLQKGLDSNIADKFSDETAKASLQNAWTTGVIRLVVAPKPKSGGYHETSVVDGDLQIQIFELSNISNIGRELIDKLGDSTGLSLNAALNWKKYEEERSELLQAIQSDVQLSSDVTLEIETVSFAAFIDKAGYKVRY